MTNNALLKPEWLEIIACCSAKVQMDLIRAIVAWQTDGTIPEFRGTKKAIFLIMVRDLDPTAASLIAASAAKQAKQESRAHHADGPQDAAEPAAEPSGQSESQSEAASSPTPATVRATKRKNSQRYFFGNRPLY